MIVERIKKEVTPGAKIPKPNAKGQFLVKGWGRRRDEDALIYLIPNHNEPSRPYQKGITSSEFEAAYDQLIKSGELTRTWFDQQLHACMKEGGCNFTTVGGVFQLLGEADYVDRGVYGRRK